jgi:hypothetical protein
MTKLLLTALLVASMATPSAAQAFTPQETADGIATLVFYDMLCGGLPSNSSAYTKHVAREWEDRDTASTAKANIMQEIARMGEEVWCEALRPDITALESRLTR